MTVIGRHDQFAIDWQEISVSHPNNAKKNENSSFIRVSHVSIDSMLNIARNKIKSLHYAHETRNRKQLQIVQYLVSSVIAGLLHRAYVKLMKSLLRN